MKKIISLILALMLVFALFGCSKETVPPEPLTAEDVEIGSLEIKSTVTEDTKFHAATVALSPEEFENAGFSLGDSVDIEFDNGYRITDVPFYNGYYVKNGEPVLVAYPGYANISITYNNMGIWDEAGLENGAGVTITLRGVGEYSDIQDSLGQKYSDDIKDYDSEAEFCNFRAMSGGDMKEGLLYRGASPVDNTHGRAKYTDRLLAEKGIALIIDLADSAEDMEGYMADPEFSSDYAAGLYRSGKTVLLDLGSAFASDAYRQRVAEAMVEMMSAEGPVYIHCMEGKDRTGFVCMLLEALAGASYDEMRADYMMTYANYFDVTWEETPEKYNAIAELYFDAFVSFLHGTEDTEVLGNADYSQDAADYLIEGGMSEAEVEELREFITE